ncbi:MAG: NADAR family protein [Kangiellaceae bacterium]|nr:NADAR family protein [Kangiellaceae bacterium]MCW9000902.1 NADAR family protein [Kangiellaceae bacterium]MCW9015879.1 NADAR family protein [Kangiellaceae bacterium]
MEVENLRSKDELVEFVAKGKKAKYLFFWGHTQKYKDEVSKSCFSQWFHSPFEIEGVNYATAEHFMMAEKARLFKDKSQTNLELINRIIEASHPQKAKKLGRQVEGFTNEEWNRRRFEIVVTGNLAKFSQNEQLREFLLSTGKRVLVEASPVDKVWGIGLAEDHQDASNPFKWKGMNLLGFVLMEVRSRLREKESE